MVTFKLHRGVALIEFALVLPLFLTLLFGVIEFGSLIFNKQQLSLITYNTVQKACIEPKSTDSNLQDYLKEKVADSGLSIKEFTITSDIKDLPRGSEIEVTIIATGDQLSWFSSFPIYLTDHDFTISSTMTKEY